MFRQSVKVVAALVALLCPTVRAFRSAANIQLKASQGSGNPSWTKPRRDRSTRYHMGVKEEILRPTLLRVDFERAKFEELREWIQRYPFGTALPVQPFSLMETETGVDVVFRKKPTLERGSQDGGLSFSVEDTVDEGVDIPAGPTLIMRRISEGQEIRKVFAERIVVKAVVRSLVEGGAPPGLKVRTVLHEGLIQT